MPHDAKACLFDILQAAADIQGFTSGLTKAEYLADARTQAAVERKFEIIGEALNRITRLDWPLAETIPDYARIIGFRNVISHGYDVVDPAIVWDAVQNHLPGLKSRVQALLNE